MHLFVPVSLYVAETPKAAIKDHEPLLPIMPFGIVAYGFVGQPFSKQLHKTGKLRMPPLGCPSAERTGIKVIPLK